MANTAVPSAPTNTRSKVILATLIGTSIEFYDFYVYATAAALVFPALFFASEDPTTALLSSFAVFGVAFIARPIGSILFGHFGDRSGRKVTLVASLLTMGIATFIIGLLPVVPRAEDGSVIDSPLTFWAPALLVLMRFAQGLGLGGEWSGAALVATENAPKGKRALYGTFPQLGAPIGFILANGVFLVINLSMDADTFQQWGWRVPFLVSAVLVIIGLWVRLSLIESTTFTKSVEKGEKQRVPLATAFRSHWRALILGTFIMLATYVLFYLMTTFSLSFGTTAASTDAAAAAAEKAGKPFDPTTFIPGLGYGRNDFVLMMIIGCVFFGIFTLISGPMADRFGRRKHLIWVTLGIIAFGFVFTPLLWGGNVGVMAFLIIGFTLMGLTFGPMASLLPELFPTNVRYTGSAFAYNFSSILGAAVAPFIAVWLWHLNSDGNPMWVGVYLASMAVLTLIALLISRETKDVEL